MGKMKESYNSDETISYMGMGKVCPYCKYLAPEDAVFCPKCGKNIVDNIKELTDMPMTLDGEKTC